jgi:hypothetical protein
MARVRVERKRRTSHPSRLKKPSGSRSDVHVTSKWQEVHWCTCGHTGRPPLCVVGAFFVAAIAYVTRPTYSP